MVEALTTEVTTRQEYDARLPQLTEFKRNARQVDFGGLELSTQTLLRDLLQAYERVILATQDDQDSLEQAVRKAIPRTARHITRRGDLGWLAWHSAVSLHKFAVERGIISVDYRTVTDQGRYTLEELENERLADAAATIKELYGHTNGNDTESYYLSEGRIAPTTSPLLVRLF